MNIEEKAVQIVVTAEVITVASIDENGYPRPVAMVKLKDENGGSYKTPLWSDWMLSHFPGEVEDSEYCVLKFTPEGLYQYYEIEKTTDLWSLNSDA
ncbi:hypothetical protein [Bacteroides thetaiotaomicron]|uniref:General stress protein n=1 Tax=Bacteroides thetaiotaomicron TaxID=818 RepID=A0A174U6G1_BACT4|nr:hypothetical protein [Bacteroides thetaiotaomicron]CUQ17973.1 general stress protein [Bacteroides thetaiotaomicron]